VELLPTSSLLEVHLVLFHCLFHHHCYCFVAAPHIHLFWIVLSVQTCCLYCHYHSILVTCHSFIWVSHWQEDINLPVGCWRLILSTICWLIWCNTLKHFFSFLTLLSLMVKNWCSQYTWWRVGDQGYLLNLQHCWSAHNNMEMTSQSILFSVV